MFLGAAIFFAGGMSATTFAGVEVLPDYSKDKKTIVQQQPVCDPRWYISVGGGGDFDFGATDINHAFTSDFVAGVPVTAFIKSHDWNAVYDPAWRLQGELGYELMSHLELFGLFKYAQAAATDRATGSHAALTSIGGDIPLNIQFGHYNSYGGEIGVRYFFLPKESRIRPYVSISAGGTYMNGIDIHLTADPSSVGGPPVVTAYRGGFFNDSWIGTGAAMLGIEMAIDCHWSVGIEGGARYESQPDENDRNFAGFVRNVPVGAFRQINNDSADRLYCPVNGYVKFRF